jgi:hypothetical protein
MYALEGFEPRFHLHSWPNHKVLYKLENKE